MCPQCVEQPLVRFTVLLTPEQKEALAADSAQTGLAMNAIVRDLINEKYYESPKAIAGWHVTAAVRRPEDTSQTPPERARLREWVSRLGSRR